MPFASEPVSWDQLPGRAGGRRRSGRDGHHPLAGQRLTFQVQVLDVREAPAQKQPASDSG